MQYPFQSTCRIIGTCIPVGPFIHSRTSFCLQCQSSHTARSGVLEIIHSLEGFDPAQSRNEGAKRLLELGTEAILFVDSDMEFPHDALLRLLGHGLDVVGADYRRRGPPFDKLGTFNTTMPQPSSGLVERIVLGFGLFMVKTDVLRSLSMPWFERRYIGEGCITEDVTFCERIRKAGYRIWADLDLSKEVKHLGVNYVGWEFDCREGLPDHTAQSVPSR